MQSVMREHAGVLGATGVVAEGIPYGILPDWPIRMPCPAEDPQKGDLSLTLGQWGVDWQSSAAMRVRMGGVLPGFIPVQEGGFDVCGPALGCRRRSG